MGRVGSLVLVALALASSCDRSRVAAAPPAPVGGSVVLSIVGTNDLHGHVRALPMLAGYLANLRRARARDGGGVVLLDGGDMFQGTLESNLDEGAPVVAAYAVLGYDAVAIGNHEFDYGPVGPNATPQAPGDDPRGALRARIAEASFPFLSANVAVRASGQPADLGLPSVMLERAGVRIGIIGASTKSTSYTTLAANVADLEFTALAPAITREARRLREAGAAVVLVTAHAGGKCTEFVDPDAIASCEPGHEIMAVAAELPAGLVDAIVAGHTHSGVAHRVNGVAIIEAYAHGDAFGRIDLTVDRAAGRVSNVVIHPPRRLCGAAGASPGDGVAACAPGVYEGAAVEPDRALDEVLAPALARADRLRARAVGPTLTARFDGHRTRESALGNLLVDLMLESRPGNDVAIINGGGLRAPLPAGVLRYGALYEAFPFDNRYAIVRMTAAELATALGDMVARDGSYFSIGGLRAEVRCDGVRVVVRLLRPSGDVVGDDESLAVLTTDFLATGGDGFFGAAQRRGAVVTIEQGEPIREVLAEWFGRREGATLDPAAYLRADAARIRVPMGRPVRCDG